MGGSVCFEWQSHHAQLGGLLKLKPISDFFLANLRCLGLRRTYLARTVACTGGLHFKSKPNAEAIS